MLIPNALGQEDILQARLRPVGSVVTIKGVTLNGEELDAVRYLQDSTAGIAVYPGGSSPSSFEQVKTGDEVQVTGVLSMYHGLLEINPILAYQVLSGGNVLPAAEGKEISELSFHDQGKLIRLHCVRFPFTPGNVEAGSIPFYTANGDRSSFSFTSNHPMISSVLPVPSLDITAIVSYDNDWTFLIRSWFDVDDVECFHIAPTPKQSEIHENGFRLSWSSSEDGDGFCMLHRSNGQILTFVDDEFDNIHDLYINGLEPAEFSNVVVGNVNANGDTAWYYPVPMTTQSSSTGNIEIYFNQPIDASFSNGSSPDGVTFNAMLQAIMDMINNAQHTIDVAMYNSNRPDIINALENAMDRGVRVRYIGDGGQSNSALDPLPDFPLLFRDGDGIMHHKFIIVDPQDPDLAKVWTGSTNHSTNQLSQDPNNAIVIHDQAMARAYLMEFEEMWGGEGDSPNPLLSRTGSAKRDDTPHLFRIADRMVESYFSPSDQTNYQISTEIIGAEESIDAALLLFTRYDLAGLIASRASGGVKARVIIDDLESSAQVVEILEEEGVKTAHHDFSSIFHHKYAIIDEGSAEASVITGSHNWTTSATVRNDENTLILHDPDIANIYRQEFEARWKEVYPVSVHYPNRTPVLVFPNPAFDTINVLNAGNATISVSTMAGVTLHTEISNSMIDIDALSAGSYLVTIQFDDGSMAHVPFIKVTKE